MNLDKIGELSKIFESLSEARKLNLSDFPYLEVNNNLQTKLKECLKEEFGDNIQFDKEETFAYVQARYKGVGIEINTWDGIIFTVEDENEASLVEDFKSVFNKIAGSEAICSYEFCSNEGGERTVYPTVEWNLDSERRLFELVSFKNYPGYVRNLEDYYTETVIKNLGRELFTKEGYKKLFKTEYTNPTYTLHKVAQIQKQNPNITATAIYAWFDSSEKRLDLSQENVYQRVYIDDGK